MMMLEELRQQREAEAARQQAEVKRWLQLAEIAVVAVLRSAAGGNVVCREAAQRMWPLLPKSLRSANAGHSVVANEPATLGTGVAESPCPPQNSSTEGAK